METLNEYDLKLTQAGAETLLFDIVTRVNSVAETELLNFGTGNGKGGVILLNCHYARLTGNDEYYAFAEKLLMDSVKGLSPADYKAALSNYYLDLAEFGTLISYLEEKGHLNKGTGLSLDEFDILLAGRLEISIGKKNFGLGNGALSLGSYLFRRLNSSALIYNSTLALLAAIDAAREGDQENGYYWTTHYFEEPRIYTGLSHGNGMMINFLCSLYELGIEREKCEELMFYAIRFLLLNKADPDQLGANFPLWLGRDEDTRNHCIVYGDLGTVYAIIKAAKILGNADYLAQGIDLAHDTVTRYRMEGSTLMDASIKYGVTSPYLLYSRIFQLTGIPAFKNAALYWFDQITEMNKRENENLGFRSHFFNKYPFAELGFSNGLAGIGLVLMQHLSGGELSINEFIWIP